MIPPKQKEHILHYVPLAVILLLGLGVALRFSYDRQLQIMTVVALAGFYVAWGVLHHALHHTLVAKIVLEYVLLAILGITIVLFLIQHTI